LQFSVGGGPRISPSSEWSRTATIQREGRALPLYYRPWRADKQINGLYFYVRTALPEADGAPDPRVVGSLDRDLPLETCAP
jgi:hypothetical protein